MTMEGASAQDAASIIDTLWAGVNADEFEKVYAVLDGAASPRIAGALSSSGNRYACLFAGSVPDVLRVCAPHLVHLEKTDRLTQEIVHAGWGRNWGIFAVTKASFDDVKDHFRTFLRVQDPSGRYLLFRYYDPRVLRVYLPTCTTRELDVVFGRIRAYLVEDGDGFTVFRRRDGLLRPFSVALPRSSSMPVALSSS